MDRWREVGERYARFARDEAPARSALYAEWASGVAADERVQRVLARIPATRGQPPLVFALTRMLGAPEGTFDRWRKWLVAHADAVVAEAAQRSLQTNEPLRCAALLPALADVPGPVGLIELGASAGLCLVPDRYSYRYRCGDDMVALDPVTGLSPVLLEARVIGDAPLRMPAIEWRAGVDLSPLDPADPDDRAFLLALVWPGEDQRARRIEASLAVAGAFGVDVAPADAGDPAVVRRLVEAVPGGLTPVVSTLGLLPHLARPVRERLIDAIVETGATWISLDPAGVHDRWTSPVAPGPGRFVLHRDGRPLAYADPLGGSVEWLPG
ncbi:DUF2332 domain-containing protein [Microbacterium aquimaris]|uniref:DUF2332 domain-containing protein n=1 Tax=Microbacterium aquimaris TaxID=459816 RepID=A0ABU5N9Y4_9MICO|nr:DUF2332 domain-containing protein [Microbacterium aquimaris]MDZ8162888.1 DUF2332 domain-containing protein [Microbacterium aquimaris]